MLPDDDRPTDPADRLVDTTGRPVHRLHDFRCPSCGAAPATRVASSGFGRPHDVCGMCGHEFAEDTVTGRTP
jgi:predicted RNA-binding Zn-ribbon protein involved in translation (DUF1610 family)